MKKQTWSIILFLIVLIFLSLLFGKQNIHEGAEANSNVVIGQNLPSFFDNIMQDLNDTTGLLKTVSNEKKSLEQENQDKKNQIKANNTAIEMTESTKASLENDISNLLINMIKKSHISEVVNLPLHTDAINKAEDLGISDPSNMTKQMNVNISGNTTYIDYSTKIDNKSCAFFKFKHDNVNDPTNSLYNYISFPFANPPQFSFCIWIYINPVDTNYYTAASITNCKNWDPSVQLDIQGSSIMIHNSLPTQWNPVLRFTASKPGWTHITYIYDAKSNYKTSMYINGVLKSNANGSGEFMITNKRSSPNYFIIGRSGDIGRGFNGYIRDFSYYAFVLPEKDILELYNKTV